MHSESLFSTFYGLFHRYLLLVIIRFVIFSFVRIVILWYSHFNYCHRNLSYKFWQDMIATFSHNSMHGSSVQQLNDFGFTIPQHCPTIVESLMCKCCTSVVNVNAFTFYRGQPCCSSESRLQSEDKTKNRMVWPGVIWRGHLIVKQARNHESTRWLDSA